MALHEQVGRRMRHFDEEAPTLKVPGQQAMREHQRRPSRGASTARLDPSYPTSVAFDEIPSEAFEGIPAVMTMGDGAGIPAAAAAVGGGG
mmetsp:Transcript_160558/g.515404  ORF Transcript_160558/g.515404 Transcript_160558/m.515404 type:complete len:90 (-) Transcript_160558:83-352(-)